MNTIPTGAITLAFKEVDNNNICHPTTIAYIQSLLKPLYQSIKECTKRVELQRLVSKMPVTLANVIREKMRQKVIDTMANLDTDDTKKETNLVQDNELLPAAKTAILSFLVKEITKLVSEHVTSIHKDTNVLPWDVQAAISMDPDFSALFEITKGENKLPVTILIDIQQYKYEFTEEFMVGLLLSTQPNVSKLNVKIVMFDTVFTADFISTQKVTRFHKDRDIPTYYRATIAGKEYSFLSNDFIQGFNTGMLWINTDPHLHCKGISKFVFNPSQQRCDITHMVF